jgi:hypothetical protein
MESEESSALNELVLLFPMKKRVIYLKRSTISSKHMWRRTQE